MTFIIFNTLWTLQLRNLFGGLLLFNQFFKYLCSFLVSFPNIAHFQNRSKLSSLQFVNVVINFIWTTYELGIWRNDCDLYFAIYRVVYLCVNHNIVCGGVKSVFDANYFELIWSLVVNTLNFLKNPQHLLFFWCVLTSQKVRNLKTNQIVRTWPVFRKLFHLKITLVRSLSQSMN